MDILGPVPVIQSIAIDRVVENLSLLAKSLKRRSSRSEVRRGRPDPGRR